VTVPEGNLEDNKKLADESIVAPGDMGIKKIIVRD